MAVATGYGTTPWFCAGDPGLFEDLSGHGYTSRRCGGEQPTASIPAANSPPPVRRVSNDGGRAEGETNDQAGTMERDEQT